MHQVQTGIAKRQIRPGSPYDFFPEITILDTGRWQYPDMVRAIAKPDAVFCPRYIVVFCRDDVVQTGAVERYWS